MSITQAYQDRRDDPRAEAALSLRAELEGAELRVEAQVGPRGVVASLERCSSRRRSRKAGRRLASFEVRESDGGLGDRAGRWASGWSMVAVYPTRLAPKADPFTWMFEQARERLSFERMMSGRMPADGNAHRRPRAPDASSLVEALRLVAEETLRRLDGKRVRLARRVHPVMRWWLYDVAGAMRREFGAEGERNLRQAVECIPGVLHLAFALDDPRDRERFDAITEVLRHIGRSSRRAPQLAGDLVHVWTSMRKRRGWLTRRNRRGRPAGEPRRDESRRAFDYGGVTALVMMSVGLGDEALVRAQRLLVLRASRHVHPDLLLVPAPPHWAPEDLPADPRACARWFGVVQGGRCHGPYGAIRDMARRRHGAWEPEFSGFVSANALALWHPCPSILAERIAAIEMWAWANGRRPCRASNPATLLAESAPFVRLVAWKMQPGRGGVTPIEFRVPATLAFEGDGIRVEPIRTATELLAEAERMRNCLGDRLDRCAAGTYVVCRAHVKGKLWSLGLCRQANRWRLSEVGGRFDCRMPWDVFLALEPYFEAADILVPGRRAPDRREAAAPPTLPEPTAARALRLEKPGSGRDAASGAPPHSPQ